MTPAAGRIVSSFPATLHGEVLVFQKMDIRQLSAEGALIETPFPLNVDSVHALRLMLDEGPVVVKGRVAHSHIANVGTGRRRLSLGG